MAYYEEAYRKVTDLPKHTVKNPMKLNQAFYDWLGSPGGDSHIIHVAGTNGKGSVCAYINSVLTQAGYSVGMFTSPHLIDIRERLKLNGGMIGKQEFAGLLEALEDKTAAFSESEKELIRKENLSGYRPSFFETLTFLFLLWMEEKKPDFILLEAGMGGRTDVTNIIQKPLLTVVTRICLDHCEYLGNTTAEIAGEKAGIFKTGVPAVCLEAGSKVNSVFAKRAKQLSAPLTFVSEKEVAFYKNKKNFVDFFIKSAYYRYIKSELNTWALYQAENAALAVRALELTGQVIKLTKEQIETGLSSMRWEARMEEAEPGILIDGAHNPDGVRAFLRSAAADGCKGRRLLLFGASVDKQTEEMWRLIAQSGLFELTAGARIDNPRSLGTKALEELFSLQPKGKTVVFHDSAHAFDYLGQNRGSEDRIYVAGSLYLAGEVKSHLTAIHGGFP